jgi:dolichol-phosphate mannosyltransferase
MGFKRQLLYYERKQREIGITRWTFDKKIKLFTDSFISFSRFPIRLIQIFGLLFLIAGFAYLIVIIYLKFSNGIAVQGIATVIAILCIVSGFLFFSLSIIGEYIWRILDETRNRPRFIIEQYRESLGKNHKFK